MVCANEKPAKNKVARVKAITFDLRSNFVIKKILLFVDRGKNENDPGLAGSLLYDFFVLLFVWPLRTVL